MICHTSTSKATPSSGGSTASASARERDLPLAERHALAGADAAARRLWGPDERLRRRGARSVLNHCTHAFLPD
jgi:hypothetical protein